MSVNAYENFRDLSKNERETVFRVFFPIGIVMMFDDPSLLYPVVLDKDKEDFDAKNDRSHVQAAHNAGVYGMNFGANFSEATYRKSSPKRTHVRSGSKMHLRAGVAGRTVDRYVFRKGATINGNITKLPTGYYGLEKAIEYALNEIKGNNVLGSDE